MTPLHTDSSVQAEIARVADKLSVPRHMDTTNAWDAKRHEGRSQQVMCKLISATRFKDYLNKTILKLYVENQDGGRWIVWRTDDAKLAPYLAGMADNKTFQFKPPLRLAWRLVDSWPTVEEIMPFEPDPDVTTLDDVVKGRAEKPSTPPEKRPKDAAGAVKYITNHLKKRYAPDGGQPLNEVIRAIYGMSIQTYLVSFRVDQAYDKMEDYDLKKLNPPEDDGKLAKPPVDKPGPVQTELPKPASQPQPPSDANGSIDTVTGEIMPDEPPAPPQPEPSKELVLFDPNRAMEYVKGSKALIDRMYHDKVLIEGVDYGPVPGTDKPVLLKPGAEKLLSAFRLYPVFEPTDNTVNDWKNGFFNFEYACTLCNRDTNKTEGSGVGSCNSLEKKYRWRWVERQDVPRNLAVADLAQRASKSVEFDFAIEQGETQGQYGKPAEYWAQCRADIKSGKAVKTIKKTKAGKELPAWEVGTTVYRVPNEEIFDLVNTISKMAQKRALVAAALNATGASAVFGQDLEDFADYGMIN